MAKKTNTKPGDVVLQDSRTIFRFVWDILIESTGSFANGKNTIGQPTTTKKAFGFPDSSERA